MRTKNRSELGGEGAGRMVHRGVALDRRVLRFRLWGKRDECHGFDMKGRGDEEVTAAAQTVVTR
jgi:hypothetical protein